VLEYTTVAIELLVNGNSGYLLLSTMKGYLILFGASSYASIDSEVIAKG